MTDRSADVVLSRPAPAPDAGPVDETLYDMVETRFRRIVRNNPIVGTYLGIHTEDDHLGDGTRDAILGELAADKAHLAAVEALDPAGLSTTGRIERDLEIHNVRRAVFDTEIVRTWERRSTALDTVGDGLFLIFAQDFAPLAERLESITGRLESVPAYLDEARTRATVPQVRLWQRLEMETARDLPSFLDEIETAAGSLPEAERRRLERAATTARSAIDGYAAWAEGSLQGGTDDWALGRERYDELVALRAFDGLDADAILAIGQEQLALHKTARIDAAREIDSSVDEGTVVERIKEDHPATFEEALEAYRDVMVRSRRHLIDRQIVTVPDDERIHVLATPEYLRNVIPFAAYFAPPKFDPNPKGIYIVTPSVGDDPMAMREHNRSSISNTSIHEAYPGHHLQLDLAARHPSLTRAQVDAPEFVEGWGMYSEQMMREQGFDDGPEFRLALATDAIWRAARIILDVRMHRGEVSIEEASDFLVTHTSFERPNALAEARRYTYTPTYNLSYLLGKVLLLQLREEEQRRLHGVFSLCGFHDALLRGGSLPISFHRRALLGEGSSGPSNAASAPATAATPDRPD